MAADEPANPEDQRKLETAHRDKVECYLNLVTAGLTVLYEGIHLYNAIFGS
jgi:hypothetical protein